MTREEFVSKMIIYGMCVTNANKFWEDVRSEPLTCDGCDTNIKDDKGMFICPMQYECSRGSYTSDLWSPKQQQEKL